jgi:hypothetical protein
LACRHSGDDVEDVKLIQVVSVPRGLSASLFP